MIPDVFMQRSRFIARMFLLFLVSIFSFQGNATYGDSSSPLFSKDKKDRENIEILLKFEENFKRDITHFFQEKNASDVEVIYEKLIDIVKPGYFYPNNYWVKIKKNGLVIDEGRITVSSATTEKIAEFSYESKDSVVNRKNNYQAIHKICVGIFFVTPLLIVFLCHKGLLGPAISLIIIISFSWLASNLGVYFYFELLSFNYHSFPNPSNELRESFQADGAARVFALFFGWMYGLIISVPFWIISWLAHKVFPKK